MATYFHGNSEIQGPDGLQTLVLMNPGGYVQYSDTPPPTHSAANNFVFLNSVAAAAAANSLNLPHAPSPHTQQFVGIPLPATPHHHQDPNSHSMHAHHDMSAMHGFIPRVQYNLWNSIDPNAAARDTPRAQQGLSLSLSSQQPGYGSSQAQAPAISGDDMRISAGSPSSASGVTNGVSGMRSTVLLSSKYLKAAQELLDEFVNVGNGIKSEILKKGDRSKVTGESSVGASVDGGTSAGGEGSGKRAAELSTAERQEIQMKKAKLINMLDEVFV